jgi:hypothetical protein
MDKQSLSTPASGRRPAPVPIVIVLLIIILVIGVIEWPHLAKFFAPETKDSSIAKQAETVSTPVATEFNPAVPHSDAEAPHVEKHGTVNPTDGTIDALVGDVVEDAPTFGVHRMDLGEATLLPPRVGCIGRFFLQKKTFVKSDCTFPSIGQQVRFHYIPGTTALVAIPADQFSEESPEYVDLWKSTQVVMPDQVSLGKLDKGSKLGPLWSEVFYQVESGSLQDGQWTIIDKDRGDRLTLTCGGLVIPRKHLSPLRVSGDCPDLQADASNPGSFKVFAMRLTTANHNAYLFGVENEKEAAERSYVEYFKASD